MSDLLIKINADAKNAQKAFENIGKQTEDLQDQLNKVAAVGAVAFAAFTAEIFISVNAFREAEAASTQLTNALQNQGIFTTQLRDEYKELAAAVQLKTGIDDDSIVKAQAVAQSFLGQTKITKDLTFAIADLAAKEGIDLNSAAEKIARTIGTSSNAFAKQGLTLDETATKAERYEKVLAFVQQRAGGLAEDFNKADGFTKALASSFGDVQEAIGARFAPVLAAVNKSLVNLFNFISQNPVLTDLIASFITAGAVVSGLAVAIPALVFAFTTLKAAVAAFGVTSNIAFAGIPALIGLVVAGLTFLALNWDATVTRIKAVTTGFGVFLVEAFEGIAKVLSGAFTLDLDQLKEGIQQVKKSFAEGVKAGEDTFKALTAVQKEEQEIQKADLAKAAKEKEDQEKIAQANLRAIRKAEIDLLKLQNADASAAAIDLKQKELDTLKALAQENSAAEEQLLREKLQRLRTLQDEQNAQDFERQQVFRATLAEAKAEADNAEIESNIQLSAQQTAQLQAQVQTELDIERKLLQDAAAQKIAARNQELSDRKKYGETIATINKNLNSEEVKGTKSASDELVALQQSKSAELKAIGKAAAVASITISTAESAMNIYKGFSTIPIIGPALGIAGAAAAVAFGGERIGQVLAAADGGLVEGGIPGRDSVPALLMPGELVVPKRNFQDVVGAVQGDGGTGSDPQIIDALERINTKLDNAGTYVFNGDVTTDEAYIDSLVRRISDAVEFRNAKIFGVNA